MNVMMEKIYITSFSLIYESQNDPRETTGYDKDNICEISDFVIYYDR